MPSQVHKRTGFDSMPYLKRKAIALTFRHRFLYKLFIHYKELNVNLPFRRHNFQIKDIVVCGGQRSGSTLLFNIIREILHENSNTIDPYFEETINYKKILHQETSTLVKKNHVYVPLLAKRIRQKKTIGFFTHRDIRDVIVSHMQIGWINKVEDWIANYKIKNMMHNALLYANTPNMHIISYDKLMHARAEVIDEIAEILNVELTPDANNRIFHNSSIAGVQKKIASSVGHNGKNHDNQLMINHIADGKTGKWKEWLSEEEISFLTEYCREYLQFFGYEPK